MVKPNLHLPNISASPGDNWEVKDALWWQIGKNPCQRNTYNYGMLEAKGTFKSLLIRVLVLKRGKPKPSKEIHLYKFTHQS